MKRGASSNSVSSYSQVNMCIVHIWTSQPDLLTLHMIEILWSEYVHYETHHSRLGQHFATYRYICMWNESLRICIQ